MSERHLDRDTLVWHYYGEEQDSAAGSERARHLDGCRTCQLELEAMKRTLATVEAWSVPERGSGYGEEVWRRVVRKQGQLHTRIASWRRWLAPARLSLGAAAAALLVGVFLLGRASQRMEHPPSPTAAPLVGERILAAALSEHLARSERILLEIVNGEEAVAVDIVEEQLRAEDLLGANRLYRQTASRQGQLALASVLEDLERVLLDVARGPHDLTASARADLRARVDDQGLVFKLRVLEARLRELGNRPLQHPNG